MANDITKNSSDIENYSKEFKELRSQILQISRSQFNGISLFTTDNAAHKEGFLHRVDNGIEYNGSSYNKFSRIASTHEDGDYDSGHESINVVNISYLTPFAAAEDFPYVETNPATVHDGGVAVGSDLVFTARWNADGSFNFG